MGLNISAYSNLKKIDCVFNADQEPINPKTRKRISGNYFMVYANEIFPNRERPLIDKGIYRYDRFISFHAGSYSGYSRWREQLAEMSGWESSKFEQYGTMVDSFQATACNAESGPFQELLCFSDCEGVIGTVASIKLANDFREFQIKANTFADDWFKVKYGEWRNCFELASKNGAVDFH